MPGKTFFFCIIVSTKEKRCQCVVKEVLSAVLQEAAMVSMVSAVFLITEGGQLPWVGVMLVGMCGRARHSPSCVGSLLGCGAEHGRS